MKFLTLLIFFLIINPNLYALTWSEIRAEIRRNLKDTTTSRQRYTDAILLAYGNEAQREIVNLTWLSEKTTSYGLTKLTTFYNLPDDVMAILQVEFTDKSKDVTFLSEYSSKKLESNNPDWRAQIGEPTDYWVDTSSDSTNMVISYIPIPTVESTGTVRIKYISYVSDMTGDSSIPFNSKKNLYPYHQSIVHYVVMRLKAVEGRSSEADFYRTLYVDTINTMRNRLGSAPNYNPSMRTK